MLYLEFLIYLFTMSLTSVLIKSSKLGIFVHDNSFVETFLRVWTRRCVEEKFFS